LLPPVLREYCRIQEEEVTKRGKNTMVMMQVGSFLEIYEIRVETSNGSEERIGYASDMGDILQKMKEPGTSAVSQGDTRFYNGRRVVSIHRYGFPYLEETKKTYITVANNKGFIVPVYYQSGRDEALGMERRECKEVWTPLIRPDSYMKTDGDQWFIGIKTDGVMDSAEMTALNPTTRSFVSGRASRDLYRNDILIQAYDFMATHPPREVVVWVNGRREDYEKLANAPEDIRMVFGIPKEATITVFPFGDIRELDVDTLGAYLSCEVRAKINELPATVLMSLDYLRNVVPGAIRGSVFHESTPGSGSGSGSAMGGEMLLTLENQALQQLNILPGAQDTSRVRKRESCVVELLNNTMTPMGTRTHSRWMTTPSADEKVIRERQEIGRWFTENVQKRLLPWRGVLKGMSDISRLFSAQVIGGVRYGLVWECVEAIERLLDGARRIGLPYPLEEEAKESFLEDIRRDLIPPSSLPNGGASIGGTGYDSYWSTEYTDFPFTEVGTVGLRENGRPPLWEVYQSYKGAVGRLEAIVRGIQSGSELGGGGSLQIVFGNNAGYQIGVYGGKKMGVAEFGRTDAFEWRDCRMVKNEHAGRSSANVIDASTRIRMTGETEFKTISSHLREATRRREALEDDVVGAWLRWSQMLRERHEGTIRRAAALIGFVDAIQSAAWNVETRGYVWPTVKHFADGGSWLRVEGLRHPLIEAIRQDVSYVSHSLSIGEPMAKTGKLVFGVNSSGKSSLMKATGIAVILAQAGMSVPAAEMEVGVFRKLYTRILGNDNLFRGLSTFRVETNELIRILGGADSHSLVLGDELCSGTEQYGAESIVAASILTLLKRGSAFVFATHWHRLRDIPSLVEHPKLGWNHLLVEATPEGGLRMDRRLMDGPGPRGYAIEFMERMGCDAGVIEEAKRIREMITSEDFAVVSARAWRDHERLVASAPDVKTAWNPRAGVQAICQVCLKNPTEETDHIVPRENSTTGGGLVGVGSVHSGGNLVGLCKSCHQRKTAGEIWIDGYEEIETPGGLRERRLVWGSVTSHPPVSSSSVTSHPLTENTRENYQAISPLDTSCQDEIHSGVLNLEEYRYSPLESHKRIIRTMLANGKTIQQIQGYLRKQNVKVTQREIRESM
jgi:hypothetical protein